MQKIQLDYVWVCFCARTRIPGLPCCPGAPISPGEPCFKQEVMSLGVSGDGVQLTIISPLTMFPFEP